MTAIPYEVAVKLSAVNGVSPVLAILAKDVLKVQGSITGLTEQIKSLGTVSRLVLGGLGVAAGTALGGALMHVANASKELLDQQNQLERQGISHLETLRMTADYYEKIGKAIPTASVDEYLKTVRELRAVTGSLPEAQALASKALKFDALTSNTLGKSGGSYTEFYKLLRSAEMKGISTNPALLDQYTDAAFSYITAFGGKLSANDYQAIAKTGGVAWMGADINKALGPISVLAADVGGDRAGTALMTLRQLQTGATTLSKQQGAVLEQLGLLDMTKVTKTGFGGGRFQVAPGGLKGSLDYFGDLPGWIRDVVFPALDKASGGNEAVRESLLGKIAPNRNAAKLIQMFGDRGFLDQIAKDLGLASQVQDMNTAYDSYLKNNPKGVEAAFNQQYKSMMETVGAPVMQAAIPVMKAVTDVFSKIGELANNNPDTIKRVAVNLGVIAGTLTVLGGAAVLSAMAAFLPGGIFTLGAAGLVVALTDLSKINWKGITDGLGWLVTNVGKLLGFSAGDKALAPVGRIESGADAYLQKQSFNPGPVPRSAQPIAIHFHVDGNDVASAVTKVQMRDAQFPSRAPYFDSYGSYAPPDIGLVPV